MKTTFKKMLAVLTAMFMVLCMLPFQTLTAETEGWDGSIATGYAGGTGAEADPYLIEDAPQLAYLAQQVNGGVNYADVYFKLNNHISLEGSEWTPIGNADNHFSGNFDGNDKIVMNVTISNNQEDYHGLFGYSDGEIKNLSMVFGSVYGDYYVGAVAGYNSGSIVGCLNTMTNVYGFEKVGGLVGENAGTVTSCENCADVSGFHSVGGIVGNSADTGNIADCHNYGMLFYYTNYTDACDIKGGVYIKDATGPYGGIVGRNAGIVTGCCNDEGHLLINLGFSVGGIAGDNRGNVNCCTNKSYIDGDGDVGGIVGWNAKNGAVSDCSNSGDVRGYYDVGGIVGYNYYNGAVTDCYNNGAVTGNESAGFLGGVVGENRGSITTSYNTGLISGANYVGGVVGYNYNKMTFCYNTGDISAIMYTGGLTGQNDGAVANCYNTGAVTANGNYVGGAAGWNCLEGVVSCCYNTGTVTGCDIVGGIVGRNDTWGHYDGIVERSYNTGAVTGSNCVGGAAGENNGPLQYCYNTGAVNGETNVGGIAGSNIHNDIDALHVYGYIGSGSVICCYNIGSVGGNADTNAAIGRNTLDDNGNVYEGEAKNIYYLNTCCENGDSYGIALTDPQMQLAESFEGFDFEAVWTMEGNVNYSYPELLENQHLEYEITYIPGDYDGNGEVNVQDAIMILRTAMSLIPGEAPAAADVNCDGIVNVQDAILALRMAMGLITTSTKPRYFALAWAQGTDSIGSAAKFRFGADGDGTPPATGFVSFIAVGVSALLAGAGVVLFRKKK